MKSADQWFAEYGESHQHPVNKVIHWICVPLIFWSIVAILWELPIPEEMHAWPGPMNWAVVASILILGWYSIMNRALALGMLVFTVACLWISWLIDAFAGWHLWIIAVIVFAAAWAGQFYGHHLEGKKPSFFKDLQFLLIGPAWLLGFIYRRFGISY